MLHSPLISNYFNLFAKEWITTTIMLILLSNVHLLSVNIKKIKFTTLITPIFCYLLVKRCNHIKIDSTPAG